LVADLLASPLDAIGAVNVRLIADPLGIPVVALAVGAVRLISDALAVPVIPVSVGSVSLIADPLCRTSVGPVGHVADAVVRGSVGAGRHRADVLASHLCYRARRQKRKQQRGDFGHWSPLAGTREPRGRSTLPWQVRNCASFCRECHGAGPLESLAFNGDETAGVCTQRIFPPFDLQINKWAANLRAGPGRRGYLWGYFEIPPAEKQAFIGLSADDVKDVHPPVF
jgi:hypothetical protein